MTNDVHGSHVRPPEFTLCGLAYDAYESGDEQEPVIFAAPGAVVTCKDCRAVINHCRAFRGYREPK